MSEVLIRVANTLSYASQVRVNPDQVHLVKKVNEGGRGSIDVYGVCINNSNGTYTFYLYAPVYRSVRVQKVTVSAAERNIIHVWQTGDVTHVGNHHVSW